MKNLPNYIIDFFEKRKISHLALELFDISWNGTHIVYPVSDMDGNVLFHNYRRSPLSDIGPKFLYDKGSKVSLYGLDKIKYAESVLICEGLNDCLAAWSADVPAVTSTGGAMSFQKAWVDLLKDKEIILSFDNDRAGGEGMAKVFEMMPHAKIMALPREAKDICEYVGMGKDLNVLLQTARSYENVGEIIKDESARVAMCQPTFFHEAYRERLAVRNKVQDRQVRSARSSDKVTNAKGYPIPELLKFNGKGQALCPFHAERTPSLQYYPKDNHCYCFGGCGKAYDAISIYMILNDVGFKQAVDDLNTL